MDRGTDMRPAFQALEGMAPEDYCKNLPTPCYIIDRRQLQKNGEILSHIIKNTGCKILLAQKAFSNYDFYPLLSDYLSGTEASGLYEARLGAEEMPRKEVHVFCAAYREDEFDELLCYADHIVFNSPNQLKKFGPKANEHGKSIGLRINPECSTQEGHEIYDPCACGSRLGTTRAVWDKEMSAELIHLLDGLHFHTLCEQNSDTLEATLCAVEEKFGDILPHMKWLNMGADTTLRVKIMILAALKLSFLMHRKNGISRSISSLEKQWHSMQGFWQVTSLTLYKMGTVKVPFLMSVPHATCRM